MTFGSILALALGLSMDATAVAAVMTAGLSALRLFAGQCSGGVLGRRLDALGGLVLVGLGGFVLFEHLGH